ncbi:MAG TPA: TadE family protein [Candidatus Dormibacteraeota bacterium]|jgi:hypothetical protein|nr:TadE family protein [Candidatus Dormibacteraeota bacterium]
MVEFALLAPTFLAFLLLIIEAGFYINAVATIDNVDREVARAVAICGATQGPYRYRSIVGVDGTGASIVKFQPYSDCQSMAVAQEDQLGYLPLNSGSPLVLNVCTAPDATGKCAAGYVAPTQAGQAVQVDLTYTYRFLIFPLLGDVGPTTHISSSSSTVAQQ